MSRAAADNALAEQLADTFGYRFSRPDLLREALTHPSASSPSPRVSRPRPAKQRGYERLEFLGDRVLGLVVADLLYGTFPEEDEGALAKRLAALARKDTLARVARAADLGAHLILSRAEAGAGGRSNPALLADACEAVIGALYLDGGLPAAAGFIRRYWHPLMAAEVRPPQDAKTSLQEWAQGAGLPLPVYRTVRTEGPPHEPLFAVEASVEGQAPVTGSGRTKRAAEQAAATALLDRVRAAHG
ncbi:MAG TPA: ribonuclease III [Methylomirabilota bacterium]|nr:ribonuclease III [Methylomirabilota bacterium]